MSSYGSSRSGCWWIILLVLALIAGAVFFFKGRQLKDVPGLEPLVTKASSYWGEPETAETGIRAWTSRTGSVVHASLKEVTGTEAILEKEDGVVLTVQRSDFSEGDRLYLSRFFGSEGEGGPDGKPRIQVSVRMHSWKSNLGRSHRARGAISLHNVESYPVDDLVVFWTWGKKRESEKLSLGSSSKMKKPRFHHSEKTTLSLGSMESIVVVTSKADAGGDRAISRNDCLIAQLFFKGELVAFDCSQMGYLSWAETPGLSKFANPVRPLIDPEITNSLGNPR